MARRKSQKRRNKKYQVSNRQLKAKRPYKDTIFRMLYHDKENLLLLYNAVNGRNYTNVEDLQIVTLENAIYMGMKNDLAFIMDMNLYLYEHQSTYNSNIPLEEAVTRAVDECIEEGILAEFLVKNKAEVIKVSIYEYDKEFEEKKLRKAEYEAGVEAGVESGIELGERSLLKKQIKKKLKKRKSIGQIADELEEEVTAIQRIIEEIQKEE